MENLTPDHTHQTPSTPDYTSYYFIDINLEPVTPAGDLLVGNLVAEIQSHYIVKSLIKYRAAVGMIVSNVFEAALKVDGFLLQLSAHHELSYSIKLWG